MSEVASFGNIVNSLLSLRENYHEQLKSVPQYEAYLLVGSATEKAAGALNASTAAPASIAAEVIDSLQFARSRFEQHLNSIPERTAKPRESGITMVMDKGLSLRQTEDFLEVGGAYTDIVKLGWATSYVTPNLDAKLKLYRDAGIPVYFGGTLFEAFIIRNQFDDYRRVLDRYKMEHAEVSDGSIEIEHDIKCGYISKLSGGNDFFMKPPCRKKGAEKFHCLW